MPEMRLIDANALDLVPDIHNTMNGVIFVNHPRSGGRTQMIVQQILTKMISNAPTIDAVPVVHGRWVPGFGSYSTPKCSCCGWCIPYSEDSRLDARKYCPNCGAKMDLKEETT